LFKKTKTKQTLKNHLYHPWFKFGDSLCCNNSLRQTVKTTHTSTKNVCKQLGTADCTYRECVLCGRKNSKNRNLL